MAAIVVGGGPDAARAVKAATSTIPIVFVIGSDPVRSGLVDRLNRPGGNITGTTFPVSLPGKRVEFLHELVQHATTVGFLYEITSGRETDEILAAARSVGWQVVFATAHSPREFETAFATFSGRNVGALIISSSPLFATERRQIAALAARYKIPAIYGQRGFADAGGLMSYGPNVSDAWRRGAAYAGRILKGEKPGDLPVELSSKFELLINLKTAKSIGLEIPPNLLALTDEVIE